MLKSMGRLANALVKPKEWALTGEVWSLHSGGRVALVTQTENGWRFVIQDEADIREAYESEVFPDVESAKVGAKTALR